jgi:hypothetical protein
LLSALVVLIGRRRHDDREKRIVSRTFAEKASIAGNPR